jgi:hypothetical protein
LIFLKLTTYLIYLLKTASYKIVANKFKKILSRGILLEKIVFYNDNPKIIDLVRFNRIVIPCVIKLYGTGLRISLTSLGSSRNFHFVL